MKLREKLASIAIVALCVIIGGASVVLANSVSQRDALRSLKRAITEANAPALTADQETQLNTLITAYRDALPDEPDEALEAAREAFDAAILAGNLTAAQAQATIIANRSAELSKIRLQALAKFQIDVQAVLKAGGQWELLKTKFGERLVGIVGSLAGGPGFGGRGPGGGHGFGFGFAPTRKPE